MGREEKSVLFFVFCFKIRKKKSLTIKETRNGKRKRNSFNKTRENKKTGILFIFRSPGNNKIRRNKGSTSRAQPLKNAFKLIAFIRWYSSSTCPIIPSKNCKTPHLLILSSYQNLVMSTYTDININLFRVLVPVTSVIITCISYTHCSYSDYNIF